MALLEWSKDLETGISKIDYQHRRLVESINSLAILFQENEFLNKDRDIEANLELLLDYTISHFAFEEGLMQEIGYSDLENHKRSHEALRLRVMDFYDRFCREEEVLEQLLEFLKVWLKDHIVGTDMNYVNEYRKKNAGK